MLSRLSNDPGLADEYLLLDLQRRRGAASSSGAGCITVGRSSRSDIELRSDTRGVSKQHAVLQLTEQGLLRVTDLGSTNCTFYTQPGEESMLTQLQPHHPVELCSGCTLYFGGGKLRDGHGFNSGSQPAELNPFVYLFIAPPPSAAVPAADAGRAADAALQRPHKRAWTAAEQVEQQQPPRRRRRQPLAEVQPSNLPAQPAPGGSGGKDGVSCSVRLQQPAVDLCSPSPPPKPSAKDLECFVCFDLMVAPHQLACGHAACATCMYGCMKEKRRCPICRAEVKAAPRLWGEADKRIHQLLEEGACSQDREWAARDEAWQGLVPTIQLDWEAMFDGRAPPPPPTSSVPQRYTRNGRIYTVLPGGVAAPPGSSSAAGGRAAVAGVRGGRGNGSSSGGGGRGDRRAAQQGGRGQDGNIASLWERANQAAARQRRVAAAATAAACGGRGSSWNISSRNFG